MRIFPKLLILMIGIALVPLISLSIFNFMETRRMGGVLASRVGSAQIDNAGRELDLWAESFSGILRNERRLLELILRFQASEVEKRLAEGPGDGPKLAKPLEPPGPEHFYLGSGVTADMVPSARHARRGEDGKPLPTHVSFDLVSFKLAPHVAWERVAGDVERLAAMMPIYRACWDKHQGMLVWMYTALDSGVHSGYPGAGGLPEDYDPRARPWYVDARASGALTWTPPYIDAIGMGVASTVSMPVRRPAGYFAGVTALDVVYVQKLHTPSSAYMIDTNVQLFLASIDTARPASEPALRIIARRHYKEDNPRWVPSKSSEWLESSDLAQYRRMIDNIRADEPGALRMAYEGGEAFWTFNPLGSSGSALVMIVPHGDILAKAEKLREHIFQRATLALRFAATGMAVAIALVVILSYLGSRSISKPLHILAGATGQIAAGKLDAPLPSTKSGDEVAELTESVASMKEDLKIYIRNLTEAISSKERLESELRIARGIQMSFLAKTFPPFPHKPEIDLYATIEPAREVGGDLYDFFLIDDAHLFFAIGDVSDKGVPAALFMAVTMSVMKGLAGRGLMPSEILAVMNRELFEDRGPFMFITLFCGVLDTRTGEVLFANAGHNPPIILPKAGEPAFLKAGKALVLAGSSRARYQTEKVRLEPGDGMFLYTDGVTEAMNESGALFSSLRLLKEMSGLQGLSPRETIEAVMESVRGFRLNARQSDDIAMLLIRCNGEGTGRPLCESFPSF